MDKLYIYNGVVLSRYSDSAISYIVNKVSYAKSKKEAIRNFEYRFGGRIIKSSITELSYNYYPQTVDKRCSCGMRLTDSNKCPKCDGYSYSIYDEI